MKIEQIIEIKRQISYLMTIEEKREFLEWLNADIKDTEDFLKGN